MRENAVILVEPSAGLAGARLASLLAVFGVRSQAVSAADLARSVESGAGTEKFCLLGSAASFLKLAELPGNFTAGAGWRGKIHSAFIYLDDDRAAFEKLARLVTGVPTAALTAVEPGAEWSVTDDLAEFCRSMSGVRVTGSGKTAETALSLPPVRAGVVAIIATGEAAAFVRIDFGGVPVFLSTAGLIDVEQPVAGRNFDLRRHFLAAVPVVLYVKWAFARSCWQPAQTAACLVIDDPLLTARYGFLNYQRLLDLMERTNFSTSIAFIPWNWNRSSPKIVRLFQENPRRLSLSVHGCDHTGGEFGSRHAGRLAWKSGQAVQRMARHRARTGLNHDPVMVFPQGVFSGAAMAALKHEEFIGVVNTEVISSDPPARPIRMADCWDPAVMSYCDCAIFTRRYPWQGVENFAFDILLGKPCLVVIHHNDCYDDCRHLVEFIGQLNRLKTTLNWMPLGDVVRRSYRLREISPGVMEVEMYGREIRIENTASVRTRFLVRKREGAPAAVREIRAGGELVPWEVSEGCLAFEIALEPGESRTAGIVFQPPPAAEFAGENLRYRVKTLARRYLCEFRDNYLMRKPIPHSH